ncbi:MAG: hypothetical protein HYV09_24810 [Deltaproteobacteria bacterium]|nr:hypothetical protein [Deltaproteobacteria bacterium]
MAASASLGCCASLQPPADAGSRKKERASAEECRAWDGAQSTWGAIGASAGIVSGSTGLGGIAVDDPAARTALAVSAALMAGVAAGSTYLSNTNARRYTSSCVTGAK